MAASLRVKSSFVRLKALLQLQRLNHTLFEGGVVAELVAEVSPETMVAKDNRYAVHVDSLKWKQWDSRSLGITQSMIPDASRIVLRILQNEGHDAYLVGGCVRDLLLNRVPKDFDVITTADLQEIKRKFHRAFIIGRRFPICKVLVKGAAVEVSSFETVARDAKEKEDIQLSKVPKGYDEKDLMLWKNAMNRDFTINSLFYDPFAHKIYDYSCGMADLTSMKLRTLVPAHLSFQEDCARILRGLRIAARLQLSFAKDTEKAMRNLCTSVTNLDKGRLMMEMNYMLSYGAAESSLLLLRRFNLLKVLLPFHAAYVNNHSGGQTPPMLMKLFFNLDNIVSCDQPCDSGLWVSLLAFHLALVNNPQDALVVWTLSSVLYHGKWKEGVKAARQLAEVRASFVPEILEPCNDVSDDELAHRVANFVSIILDAVDALTDSESLLKAMSRFPSSPCSGLVFVSRHAGKEVAQIFDVLVSDIKSLSNERCYSGVNYKLLGKGNIEETRFVLGKVIMDTMRGEITECRTKLLADGKNVSPACKPKAEQGHVEKPDSAVSEPERLKSKDWKKRVLFLPDDQLQGRKKQKQNRTMSGPLEQKVIKEKMNEILSCRDIQKKKQQLKKGVVKDVKKLLSLKKKAAEKGAKLEMRHDHETQVLEKSPKLVKQDKVQAPTEMREKLPKLAEESVAQHLRDVPGVQKKAPKMKQPEAKGPTEMLKVLNLPNLFKSEKELIKGEARSVKEEIEGEQPPQKLSSIFK
uniref:Polynucleotide adenylyltransferase n=1 Tax=Opuntia streptacantha TaxID=393608 RepID=A0A7C9EV59_OPUST